MTDARLEERVRSALRVGADLEGPSLDRAPNVASRARHRLLQNAIAVGIVTLIVLAASVSALGSIVRSERPLPATSPTPSSGSGDGRIAYVEGSEIWTVRADGTGAQQLTRCTEPCHTLPDSTIAAMAWSPDGSEVAFSRVSEKAVGPGFGPLYVVSEDGSLLRRLTGKGFLDADPVWSPDGSKIAFARYGRSGRAWVYVVDAAGGKETLIDTGHFYDLVWSPDGSSIAYEAWRHDRMVLFSARADGSDRAVLAEGPRARPRNLYYLALSPDWGRVAYSLTATTPEGNRAQLWVADLSGGKPMLIASRATRYPLSLSWSPDGARMTFWDYHGQAFEIRADGTGLRPLGQTSETPTFAPGGQEVAIVVDGHLRLVRADGSSSDLWVHTSGQVAWQPRS